MTKNIAQSTVLIFLTHYFCISSMSAAQINPSSGSFGLGDNVSLSAVDNNAPSAPTTPCGCMDWVGSTNYVWTGDIKNAPATGASATLDTSTSGSKKVTLTITYSFTCSVTGVAPVAPVAQNVVGSYNVAKVSSLTPDAGIEIDDGDNNADTKTYTVCARQMGVITVTATPDPNLAEADLPAGWTMSGGTGTGKLSRTIDRTTGGTTVITCTSGTSTKTTTIHVLKFGLSLRAAGDGLSDGDNLNFQSAQSGTPQNKLGRVNPTDNPGSKGFFGKVEIVGQLTPNVSFAGHTLVLKPMSVGMFLCILLRKKR